MSSSIVDSLSPELCTKVATHLAVNVDSLSQIDSDSITWAVADILAIPMIPIGLSQVDRNAYFSRRSFWHEVQAVPIFEADVMIQVACARPWDMVFHRHLLNSVQRDVRLIGAALVDIAEVLGALHSLPEPPPLPKDEVSAEMGLRSLDFKREDIVGWWKRLVLLVRSFGASDIHVAPFHDRLCIRARIRGSLETLPPLSPSLSTEVLNTLKAHSGIPTNEPTVFHDGKATFELLNESPLELRVCSGPTPDGEAMAFRILDPSKMKKVLGTLPFGGAEGEMLLSHIQAGSGIILVTGPTGSGKSTTLYRILFCVDRVSNSVQTIEQPVEYRIDLVNQYEINDKKEFASATRFLMRLDPDVILVGEIRDEDTATTCSELGLTGHLVFSTLHVTSAPEAIPRLRRLGVPDDIIAATLSLVIAQRLVATLCPTCRRKVPISRRVVKHMEKRGITAPEFVYERAGCNRCLYLGISGVAPIFEIFEATQTIKDMIVEGKSLTAIREVWESNGGRPLVCHGLRLVAEGTVPYSEVSIYETDRSLLRPD